jgi:hypothetical protein
LLLEQAEQLKAGRFTEEAEKLAVFLQQLKAGKGVRTGQRSALYDVRRIMVERWGCLGAGSPSDPLLAWRRNDWRCVGWVEAQQGLPEGVGVEIVVVVDGRENDRRAMLRWIASKDRRRRWTITMVSLSHNRGACGARSGPQAF